MGTWGTALFSDDTARDIRDDYRELISEGLPGPDATDALLSRWADGLQDSDDGPVIWLALAATQWKCGRLEPRVLQRALQIVDQGLDLQRWEDEPKLRVKRQVVLEALRQQLTSPQPPAKRIPKRFQDTCEWEVGEVISYRLLSGSFVFLRVTDLDVGWGGTSPIVEVLDWIGSKVPSEDVIAVLAAKQPTPYVDRFVLFRTRERELPVDRVGRLGIRLNPTPPRFSGSWGCAWKYLDERLDQYYNFR